MTTGTPTLITGENMNITIRLSNFTGLDPHAYIAILFSDDGTWTRQGYSNFPWCPSAGVWGVALALETHMKISRAGKPICILSDCNLKNPSTLPDEGEFYWYKEEPIETIGGKWTIMEKS